MDWDICAYDIMLTFQVAISRDVELPLIHNEHMLRAHSILDVGCGNGSFTALLADKYPDKQFVAIDNNGELISFARQYYSRKNITYIVAGYSEFDSADLFNMVIARLVVHIIPKRYRDSVTAELIVIDHTERSREMTQALYAKFAEFSLRVILSAGHLNYHPTNTPHGNTPSCRLRRFLLFSTK